ILEYLRTIYRTYSEISIAILMAGGLALALVLMNLSGGNSATSIQSYLFGSIVTITWEQVIFLGILFVAIGILFFLFKRPMYVLTFDEDTAHVDGLPVHLMSMMFNVITGVAIAVMIPIAGALLISAIMVLPAAIGMRLGKSFNVVIAISVCVGFLGMLSGLTSSFYLDT
ncbi:TPA: metal ABC transporter permease, partial [Enterococcus faecium]